MSKVTKLAGNFGRLWSRSHESFSPEARRILSVKGKGATTYLQGLITCDLLNPPTPPREEKDDPIGIGSGSGDEENTPPVEFSDQLRATCFLDNKGRILTDSLLWKVDEEQYFVDVPGASGDQLLAHMKQFVLRRSKVKVADITEETLPMVVHGTMNASSPPEGYLAGMDPRHPSLGMRVLSLQGNGDRETGRFGNMISSQFPAAQGTYNVVRKLAGVAEGSEIHGKIAGECNQEFLNAVSFQKGCYLGQELTARVQYTGAIRKRVLPIMIMDVNMEIPRPWLVASQIQQGRADEDASPQIGDGEDDGGVVDEIPRLPRISASGVAEMIGTLTNPRGGAAASENDNDGGDETVDQITAQSQALFEQLQTLKKGDKIIDMKEQKTIGQIIAAPEEGTNVVLAQMRLDRVGLLGDGAWTHTNKITIGDSDNPLRYLPYLPLWWPQIDRSSGKAKED